MQFFVFIENDLICDCDLLWYKQWLMKPTSNNYEKVREVALKTQCWTTSPKHQYSVTKVSVCIQIEGNLCLISPNTKSSCALLLYFNDHANANAVVPEEKWRKRFDMD